MRIIFSIIGLIVATAVSYGQIISQFTWDAGPVTSADIGPDGTAVSGSAISDIGGVGGTNGLNAGLPKADINMTIPGSPTFDVAGIDISFDYHREESQGNWWRRGSSLILDGTNQLAVSYRVSDGGGGFITVNSGNVYAVPNDDTYRTYRFFYLPVDGLGVLSVDGTVVWTNDGPDNRDLYWTGAGDVTVCEGIDGTGFDDTFMDNLTVASVTSSALPIDLVYLKATPEKSLAVDLFWRTKSEIDNDYFTIERSKNGEQWHELMEVDGAGNSSVTLDYHTKDLDPLKGVSYYRLKQTDFNGDFEYSEPVQVILDEDELILFPNPTSDYASVLMDGIREEDIAFFDGAGRRIKVPMNLVGSELTLDVSEIPPGVYIMSLFSSGKTITKRLIVR